MDARAAARRDPGGTGSACLPRPGARPAGQNTASLHPGLLLTRCRIVLLRAGGPVEALAAQAAGGRRGAKAALTAAAWALPLLEDPELVWISLCSWLSFPQLDFSSVLQIPLGAAL